MIYAFMACLVVVTIGMLVLVHEVVVTAQEHQEQAQRETIRAIERLLKAQTEQAGALAASCAQSAADMAVEIAGALVGTVAGAGDGEAEEASERASGFETADIGPHIAGTLTDDIETFYGVGDTNTEDAFVTERVYEPDADKFDPKTHPMARQFGWVTEDGDGR